MASVKVQGNCRLCSEFGVLKNSHIIPEFFYKPLYDDKHRFLEINLHDVNVEKYLQKGMREHLLCAKCEEEFSKYEGYVRHFIFSTPDEADLGLLFDRSDNSVSVEGVDYSTLRLFQLSVIWRASISTLGNYSAINLGPHEERIRSMLVDSNPGDPLCYPCVMEMITTTSGQLVTEVMLRPGKGRMRNARDYRLFFGGFMWHFLITGHRLNWLSEHEIITPDGGVRLLITPASRLDEFDHIADRLKLRA